MVWTIWYQISVNLVWPNHLFLNCIIKGIYAVYMFYLKRSYHEEFSCPWSFEMQFCFNIKMYCNFQNSKLKLKKTMYSSNTVSIFFLQVKLTLIADSAFLDATLDVESLCDYIMWESFSHFLHYDAEWQELCNSFFGI